MPSKVITLFAPILFYYSSSRQPVVTGMQRRPPPLPQMHRPPKPQPPKLQPLNPRLLPVPLPPEPQPRLLPLRQLPPLQKNSTWSLLAT